MHTRVRYALRNKNEPNVCELTLLMYIRYAYNIYTALHNMQLIPIRIVYSCCMRERILLLLLLYCIAWLKIICYDACTLRVLSKFHTRRHATNLIDDISNYIGAINYFVSFAKCRVLCAYVLQVCVCLCVGLCVCGVYTNQLKLTIRTYNNVAQRAMCRCRYCICLRGKCICNFF